jgi:predicted lipid-binding transport protein (Tim44 family)
MSKLLKEGLFDALINLLARGKMNAAAEQLKKDPDIRKSIENIQAARQSLQTAVDAYVEKYGESEKLKKFLSK